MQKQTSDETRQGLDALKELSMAYDRDQVIYWIDIERAVGFQRNTPMEWFLRHLVQMWQRWMSRERGIEVWSVRGVGYRLLTDGKQVTLVPEKRTRKALFQQRRIIRSVKSARNDKLTDHERRMAIVIKDSAQRAAELARLTTRVASEPELSEQAKLFKKLSDKIDQMKGKP